MFKVLDIRGTHGSGKSFIPLRLLEKLRYQPVIMEPLTYSGKEDVVAYYIPDHKLYILGRYETACGGCDGIKTQAEIKARAEYFRLKGNVLLEGILVAHTFGPWSEFARGKPWKFLFLDTPLDVCITRVNMRRAKAGKNPLADPRNIVRDHARINSLQKKFEQAGHYSKYIDYKTAVSDVLEVLYE